MKKLILEIFILSCIMGCSSTKNMEVNSFSSDEIKRINSADSLTPMRVFKINNKKDSLLLRTKSSYIKPDPNNKALQLFIKRLHTTVIDSMSMGVGIAAPQVGILKNIIWVQRFDKENFPFEVYLNPKIIKYSEDKQTVKEGCLSIPNRTETLNSRAQSITIEYDTMKEEHKTETIKSFTSVIFQHEIDHLSGILYLDHLDKEIRDAKKPKTN
ncbi:peptide deformylase [Flavivirga abyssicola]|uniref:peptide deformylase n=1 Tax=Flavivirga abyssicola TaxID=3063533 RepID=UPI0026DF64EF|nr:peptide deformylase [Flavivirga sp. MEBiC07777]WVK14245.1 peptide deformylase [Flavivirga sp. MEBiC07777]